jgi:hypothetical protein
MRRGVQIVVFAIVLVVAVGLSGCGSSEQSEEEARVDIQVLLEAYLPLLGEAYSENDAQRVAGLAAGREVSAVEKRLRDIRFEGRRLQPTFRSFSIEEIKIWGYANAYVTTNEIWDIRTFATGAETMLTEQLDQRNRVKYQLKKIDGAWTVLFRTLLE